MTDGTGPADVGPTPFGAPHFEAGQFGAGQFGAGQFGAGQFGAGQFGAGRSRTSGVPAPDFGEARPAPGAASGDDVLALADTRPREFEEFVRTETAGLLRSAYLLAGNAATAEDVVQETLTRLYPKWSRVQAANYPVAYVRRSLVNTYLNSVRSKSSREIVVDDIGDRPAPTDLAQSVTDRDLVWSLLDQVGERQRTALVLRYFHDWPDRDIARAMGCRTGTVRSLISRGLAVLRSDARLGDRDA